MTTNLHSGQVVDDLDRGPEESRWTVADLLQSIVRGSEFPHDWLYWPPDVFALTSLIFKQTGCYRLVFSDYPDPQWQADVEAAAREWLGQVNRVLEGGDTKSSPIDFGDGERTGDEPADARLESAVRKFNEACDDFARFAPEVKVEDLQLLSTSGQDHRREDGYRPAEGSGYRRARKLCEALIRMHAVADEACSGFGLPISPPARLALTHCLANLLLTTRGSLSAIPKHHGVVLPKLRTPQSGLTLRSFSHHATFHSSEVEVMWRAVPWTNLEENTVNVLCIPWPSEVKDTYFCAEDETFAEVRYLQYDPPEREDYSSHLEGVIRLIRHVKDGGRRLHLLVFPEACLSNLEYRELLRLLRDAHDSKEIDHVPLVLAGVRHKEEQENAPEEGSEDRREQHLNEVRLATFFAGRWYDLRQLKHHRWRINRKQIRQYQLEGRLTTPRDWYEHIPIQQRRLTVLAPNNWLALCPLICEDLAQLEPVSELIRGVGPTLLVALLLDGPQLTQRWSARYASVFADDPGTAVLTLTSVGMTVRSRRLDNPRVDEKASRTVGLWRDEVTGWHDLDLAEAQEAILLTISSDWTTEYTADGRGDHQNAAVFKFEGSRGQDLPEPTTASDGSPEQRESGGSDGDSRAAFAAPSRALAWLSSRRTRRGPRPSSRPAAPQKHESQDQEDPLLGRWADIRELTALTFALDASLGQEGRRLDLICDLLLGRTERWDKGEVPRQLSHLIGLLSRAQEDPAQAGVAARKEEWPSKFFRTAVDEMKKVLEDSAEVSRDMADYWKKLVEEAATQLPNIKEELIHDEVRRRALRSVYIAILAALYNRMEKYRRLRVRHHDDSDGWRRLPGDGDHLPQAEAAKRLKQIEKLLSEYG